MSVLAIVDPPEPRAAEFAGTLARHGMALRRAELATLQVNVGKLCNQACRHCHVDAGPRRTEIMSPETAAEVAAAIRRCRPATVDLTGGAPELCPSFRFLVAAARDAGSQVVVRHNLTVMHEPGQEDLPQCFAANRVEVVSSLPCYGPENVDKQRGKGVFDQSIAALRRLNAAGYARPGTGLKLHLVYNPLGPSLPPPQAKLEADYRRELDRHFGVAFDRLYVLANMPIHRFLDDLRRQGQAEEYQAKLVAAFNPATVDGLMCRTAVSVGWRGELSDCDFNLMLEMPLPGGPRHVRDLTPESLADRAIATATHCFGCTAGSGSSCGGAIVG